LAALAGAWGAISVFVGPVFGYQPTSASSWDWTIQNWLLHLAPGAGAVTAGLMIMSLIPSRRAGAGGPGVGLAALLLVAAGAWFVIGPALWPTFESSSVFMTGTSSGTAFINQLGSSLGPGLLLVMLGGMALKAAIARPRVTLAEPAGAADSGVAPSARAEPLGAVPATSEHPTSASPEAEGARAEVRAVERPSAGRPPSDASPPPASDAAPPPASDAAP
jgi:hypothetical protein